MTTHLVTPGDPLFPATTHAVGPGTHVLGGSVCASLVGRPSVVQGADGQPTVSVTRPPGASTVATPAPGDIVTARVLRTSPRAAGVEILCIDGEQASTPLRYPPPGVIRAADVRATAVDSVDVGACFRPGDLVRAVVLSLGDARAYYLSTAGDALGVVSARSASHPARPFLQAGPGGQDMACPLTGVTEPRKVARQ